MKQQESNNGMIDRTLVGKRVEIPAHYDAWMQGARFGLVTSFRSGKPGYSAYVNVRLDRRKKLLKVWQSDCDYLQVI